MSIEQIYKRLTRAGLDCTVTTICNIGGTGRAAAAVIVKHDYFGPYPSAEALQAHAHAAALARRHGYQAPQRGHYTATLIYK